LIEISTVRLGEEEEKLVLEVLRSGRLAQGPVVERFEAAFSAITGTADSIAVSSGTTALVAALEVLGLGAGDEVITSPFTFVATLNAILQVGATARFVDISDDDFTIDAEGLNSVITPKTKVLMPVHLYGQPADMTRICAIADKHGLAIVEDAAQAHGAAIGGRSVGSFGLGCFSFYATKNVTTGEGGMITTNDAMLADQLRLLRGQGMRSRYQYEIVGHNYRMTEIQAAIGLPQLARLPEITRRRQENAASLSEGLAGISGLRLPKTVQGRTHVFHQYTVRVTSEARIDRDKLASLLAQEGIGTGVYYPRLVFDYDCFRAHPLVAQEAMPRAEVAAREVLSLPVHHGLAAADISRIVDAVRRHLDG